MRRVDFAIAVLWSAAVAAKIGSECAVVSGVALATGSTVSARALAAGLVLVEATTAVFAIAGRTAAAASLGTALLASILTTLAWSPESGEGACGCLPGLSLARGQHIGLVAALLVGHVVALAWLRARRQLP